MKKIALMLLVVALAVALGACAFAEYVNKDGAKVYADWDTDSKVIARLSKGDKVTVLDVVDMQGKWNEVSIKVKGKKKTGFMLSKYLDENAPCNHKWGKWVVIDEPTCTETGYRQRQCVKCGILDDEVMPKTGHTYGKWKITREPTCTKEGQRVRTCKICGHKQTKTIEKEPHDYGKWTVTEEPTCTAKGSRYHKCRVCGHKETQVMDKLPHDYGEWIVDKEASCTEEGMRHRTCQSCGHVQEKAIEMLPHDYRWKVTERATDHSSGIRHKVCLVCGHTEPDVSYDPKGTLRRGDRGDDVRQVQQQLADQGYLTAKGVDGIFGGGMEKAIMQFQKDQNLNPDGVAWPQTIKRLNHDFGPWTLDKPLTRTSNGERVRVCKDCGLEQRETIEAGVIERKGRGEDVRAIQKMLGELGYNPGAYDGIYGAKLDLAYADFAADHGVDFQPGSLWPGQVDALVNGWMAARSPEKWKGEGDASAPVDLALTVTPAEGAEADGDLVTYNWTLTNLGSGTCTFNALLLSYGDAPDFRQNTITVAIDGVTLKANRANSTSGSFTVAAGWGEGRLNFCAMAVVDKTGDVWNSNVVSY